MEFAICVLVPLFLIAGIIEYGSLFGNMIDVTSASRGAARVGVETTTTVPGDAAILAAIDQLPGAQSTNIQEVVIYKASGPSAAPPPSCVASNPPPSGQLCDVYTSADLSLTDAQLAALPGAQGWPPSARVPGSDYLGVWVHLSRKPLFGLVWSPTSYSDNFAMQIAPVLAQSSTPGGWTQTGANPGWNDSWFCWSQSTGVCSGNGTGTYTGTGGSGSGGGA